MVGPIAALLAAFLCTSAASPHQDYVFVPVPIAPITAVVELRSYGDVSGSNNVRGKIVFVQSSHGGPVFLFGNITGLAQGQHGLHIHEYGDISQGCKTMGKHFNPHFVSHGGPADLVRHVGDLGNVKAEADGKAKLSDSDWAVSLIPGSVNNIIGRGLVVHEARDDLGRGGDNESLRTGNAGGRLACGVIAFAPPQHPPPPPSTMEEITRPPKR